MCPCPDITRCRACCPCQGHGPLSEAHFPIELITSGMRRSLPAACLDCNGPSFADVTCSSCNRVSCDTCQSLHRHDCVERWHLLLKNSDDLKSLGSLACRVCRKQRVTLRVGCDDQSARTCFRCIVNSNSGELKGRSAWHMMPNGVAVRVIDVQDSDDENVAEAGTLDSAAHIVAKRSRSGDGENADASFTDVGAAGMSSTTRRRTTRATS